MMLGLPNVVHARIYVKKYIVILAFIIIQGCSSNSGDSAPTPIAKVLITNGTDGEFVIVTGVSSVGTREVFVITSTDVNDATPNILEKGEVGVIEITACDVLWELSYSVFFPDNPSDNYIMVEEMQMYSCDTEYEFTCSDQTFDFLGQPITLNSCATA
jgi:hypothetical protein